MSKKNKNVIFNNRWKVIEKIGNGGQGEVYKVADVTGESDKLYALKLLMKQQDEDRRKRMYREVKNVTALQNDHLIEIIDSNIEMYKNIKEKLYYVSAYLEGCDLEEYVKNNEISFQEALSFFKDLLNVISYCHNHDIIHRDIKPENILLNGKVLSKFVIIDFGLSFNNSDEDSQETWTLSEQQLGNRFILLPELVAGNKEQKRLKCSDITQACGVFFFILTKIIPNTLIDGEGKKPHERNNGKAKLSEVISNPRELENIIYIFDKAFNSEVQDRYNDTQELINDLNTLDKTKVDMYGGAIMETKLTTNNKKLLFSKLMESLNPCLLSNDSKGLRLPPKTNIPELLNYAYYIPKNIQNTISFLYDSGQYYMPALTVWEQAVDTLRKRVLSLGIDFVGDMIASNDKEYIENLPPYRVICLANEIGFIDNIGMRNLISASDMFNKCKLDMETIEDYLMPEDEANIIIKYSIAHILYFKSDNENWQFNDFRNRLKNTNITDSDISILVEAHYFYKKTTVRSLVNLYSETNGIEFEFVCENLNHIVPKIWRDLENDERRLITHLFEKYHSENNADKSKFLKRLLLSVNGFDYVSENLRSSTYVDTAKKLIDIHFGFNNFYNEPSQVKYLSELGTKIPQLALNVCMRATIYVKIGNIYGISNDAQKYANKILDLITEDQWTVFLEKYVFEDDYLVNLLSTPSSVRRRWEDVVDCYKLKQLNLSDKAKKIL